MAIRRFLHLALLASLVLAPLPGAAAGGGRALERLKARYARPAGVPFPADNPFTPEKAALGERLFHEPLLSQNGSFACATCHDPGQGFADGQALGRGVPGELLPRHTPTLWNLAWAPALFWDGRAASLEEQAKGPIQNPKEMAQPLAEGVRKLAAREDYRAAFARAFPASPVVDETRLLLALATYERTLVSPVTRFDRWITGDANALDAAEIRGFLLFNGKAGCANCHEGWAFTDHGFHDIGLPGGDRGRGAVIGLDVADHAFKTPSLRELGRTAPYMHDGRFATLDEVLDHYTGGIVERPSLSPDLRRIALTPDERRDLLAFLGTLTAKTQEPAPLVVAVPADASREEVVATGTVRQKDKRFAPGHIRIAAGERLTVVNDDSRTHNVRVSDPRLAFDSGAQDPGQSIALSFAEPGRYQLFCGIHPAMRLTVEVESAGSQ
ncbi:cytochrome c peroxidase [Benzoatithermus flavus]|uniref:Cytochrome c peroxidase n=1 Tax=Benzoatithermus flavus TaxID=3108223 RepID=A0ABU8XR84_9PROT